MSSCNVLIVGGTSLNTIIQLDAPLREGPHTVRSREAYPMLGGTGAGKALNFARLGTKVTLHTVLGRDREADMVARHLNQPNIDLLVDRSDLPTEQHVNIMDPKGDRISIYTHPPDDSPIVDWEPIERAIQFTDMVAITIYPYTLPVIEMAKRYDKPLWMDIHNYDGVDDFHRPFITAASVLFVSDENLPAYREFMKSQIATGKELVVCTRGVNGACALTADGEWFEQEAIFEFDYVDSNGAGDAFFCGFYSQYVCGASITRCLKHGALCGALAVATRDLAHPDLLAMSL